MESHASLLPEDIGALGPKERQRAYKMFGMESYLKADGSFALSEDMISFLT